MTNKIKPLKNFFKHTFCSFEEVEETVILNKIPDYTSASGSSYYYVEKGVFRKSTHWGRLGNCKWRLEPISPSTNIKYKVGYADWTSFYPDNSHDNLYYIAVDFEEKTAQYFHKNDNVYNGTQFLRNDIDTKKRLKQIRSILNLTSWAKYYDYDDLEVLRKAIVTILIESNTDLAIAKQQGLEIATD